MLPTRLWWKNAEYTEICLKAQKIFDKAERTKLYMKLRRSFTPKHRGCL